MGIGKTVIETMKSTVLLNEKITNLTEKVSRIDTDQRSIHDRVTRVEARLDTIMDFAKAGRGGSQAQIEE